MDNLNINFKNFTSEETKTEIVNFLQLIEKMKNYKANIGIGIDICDKQILDIRHIIRDQKLDATYGSKLLKILKEVEQERKRLKEEIEIINRVPDRQWNEMYSSVKGLLNACEMSTSEKYYQFRSNIYEHGDFPETLKDKLKNVSFKE